MSPSHLVPLPLLNLPAHRIATIPLCVRGALCFFFFTSSLTGIARTTAATFTAATHDLYRAHVLRVPSPPYLYKTLSFSFLPSHLYWCWTTAATTRSPPSDSSCVSCRCPLHTTFDRFTFFFFFFLISTAAPGRPCATPTRSPPWRPRMARRGCACALRQCRARPTSHARERSLPHIRKPNTTATRAETAMTSVTIAAATK